MTDVAPRPADAPEGGSKIENPRSRFQRLLDYRRLLAIGFAVLISDQISKSIVAARLPFPTYGEPAAITVVPDFFYIVHVGNTGAAWSMFSGQGMLLALLAAATLIAIFLWRRALGLRDRMAQISFGLLTGGIAGNLVDRLVHGHVVDFIDLHFGTYVYPTFNVADSGICAGVILYLWHSFREPGRAK
ncbi:signal peptidase II [Opitutus terrae]|uniref:Lipoprotein signal peptidase n=1 Tax=Opitutus terrae (strain DSM 11246 / JCM 15787 / PB90-1) TaxID=452637 RepID=B1ZV02_OPITP|nr:signal peptidase II [Opitutus terrae]ACB75972.1 lipoprotein signal peptidase [Opitutus terrae PB90-1]